MAKSFQTDAIARKDRHTQELFSSMMNEVMSIHNMCDPQCISEYSMHANVIIKNVNIEVSDDLKQTQSLAANVINPSNTPPIPEKIIIRRIIERIPQTSSS